MELIVPHTAAACKPCDVCGYALTMLVKKGKNALPAGVWICRDCYEAVARRAVGISRNPDGTLDIVDGRPGR